MATRIYETSDEFSQLPHNLLQFARDPLGITCWLELNGRSDLYLYLTRTGKFLSCLLHFEQAIDAHGDDRKLEIVRQ